MLIARRLSLTAGIAALVAALTLTAPPTADARKKRKPDVKVRKVENRDYVVTPDQLDVSYKLKNVGDKEADIRGVEVRFTELTGDLPALAPAFVDVDSITIQALDPDEARSQTARFDVPLGRYQVEVCVKYKRGKRKAKDCKNGTDFSAIPQSWQGTATVTGPLGPGVTRSHKAQPGMGFFFAGRAGSGFKYEGSGSVRFSVTGTDPNGCKWSGQKTVGIRSSETLTLNEDLLGYTFKPSPGGQTYPAAVECPPPLADFTFNARTELWLIPLPQTRDRSTSPTLAPRAGFASLGPIIFTWNLTAR